MSKERIASDYLAQTKAKYGALQLPIQRDALVIGAAKPGSIGAAVFSKLVGDGFRVHIPPMSVLDVTDAKQLEEAFVHRFSPKVASLDTLVLCNGYTYLDWFENTPVDQIVQMYMANVVGSHLAAQAFVRAYLEAPWRKNIVFIGSMAYRNVLNGSSAYCASKAALAMLTRCLAWELAPKGFDVFCVHPSNVEGAPMSEDTIQDLMRYRGLTRPEAEAYWGASLPREKWLQPADVAECVRYLVSGKASYQSGANIELAGGQR